MCPEQMGSVLQAEDPMSPASGVTPTAVGQERVTQGGRAGTAMEDQLVQGPQCAKGRDLPRKGGRRAWRGAGS